MQHSPEAIRAYPEIDSRALIAATKSCDESGIDPMTLARLDIGLFRCLRNLGTSRQRVCSALCLSYAEYDYISKLWPAPG